MVEFTNLKITEPFRYLWFKYITDVDLNVHCAKTFIGEYSKKISPRCASETILFDEFPDQIFYLCGVHSSFDWNKNFHLAFKLDPRTSFEIDELGIEISVTGAERLPISTEAMLSNAHPRSRFSSYHTCRNWQFANYLARFPELFTETISL